MMIPLSAQAKAFSQRLFNQAFYLDNNSDVLTAVSQGLTSAFEHFSTFGHRENRPLLPFFDTQAYLLANLDVANATTHPGWVSAWNHFVMFGILEGRSPNGETGFTGLFDDAKYLQQNSDVKNAVSNGAFRNGFEHYLLFGAKEGRAAFDKAGNTIDFQSSMGKTFTLTTGPDNVSGTDWNDIINAPISSGSMTFGALDKINGGGGNDTLNIYANATGIFQATFIKNVENINLNSSAPGATISLLNASGYQKLGFVNSTNTGGFTNIGSIVNLEVVDTNQSATFTFLNSVLSGANDSVHLTLKNVTGGTVTLQPLTAGSGYEMIIVDSQGAVANKLTSLTDGNGNSLSKVVIIGNQNLTLPLGDNTVTEVDASAFTGQLNLKVAAGSGNIKITGGSKNDVIDMNGTYNANDIINGGAGIDRLVLQNAQAILATTVQSNVSNIEVIQLADGLNGTVTVSNFGATGLRFGAAMSGNGIVKYAAGTNSLDLQDFGGAGNDLTVNIAGTATNDVLNIILGSDSAGSSFGAGDITINGAETVNLLVQGGAGNFGGKFTITNTAATEALVITGKQDITFTGEVRADIIDASGMTGVARLIMNDAVGGGTGTTATIITGTANDDTLVGSTAADVITGGAGNDMIVNVVAGTPTTAGDILTGGAGFDTFILRGDAASAPLATLYNNVSFITDFTVGNTASTTDILALSATIGNYSGGSAFFGGVGAATAGNTTIMNVAQNAPSTAILTGTDLIRLTTGVATTGLTAQQAFDAAIGSAQVTGLSWGDDIFVMFYDTTNSRAVIGLVDAGWNGIVEMGDTITIIGSIAMSASDYAAFNQNHLAIIAN